MITGMQMHGDKWLLMDACFILSYVFFPKFHLYYMKISERKLLHCFVWIFHRSTIFVLQVLQVDNCITGTKYLPLPGKLHVIVGWLWSVLLEIISLRALQGTPWGHLPFCVPYALFHEVCIYVRFSFLLMFLVLSFISTCSRICFCMCLWDVCHYVTS